jgi:lipopolysaccharide transport system ATP-binding protein
MSHAIRAAGVWKEYVLGGARTYDTFYEAMTRALLAPYRRLRELAAGRPPPPHFWALRDLSFEMPEGEVLGVVGHNGAGKSTLLKILSRITGPTRGRVEVRGRVASLLEVGTGFHPELTGRENVFLNGAILGMSRRELARRFDEIVDFAGIETFIDTPVKRYSSGMYVRLAFAVAAHIETDILLIDEVLAVGDAAFRAKCLRKMENAAQGGRTVLFVSHDLTALESLAHRCLLLEQGRLLADGAPREVLDTYLRRVESHASRPLDERERRGNGAAQLVEVRLLESGDERLQIACGSPLTLELTYDVLRPIRRAAIHVTIYELRGREITLLDSHAMSGRLETFEPGRVQILCHLDRLPLQPTQYWLNISLRSARELVDSVPHATTFTIAAGDFYGTGSLPESGPVLLRGRWEVAGGAPS